MIIPEKYKNETTMSEEELSEEIKNRINKNINYHKKPCYEDRDLKIKWNNERIATLVDEQIIRMYGKYNYLDNLFALVYTLSEIGFSSQKIHEIARNIGIRQKASEQQLKDVDENVTKIETLWNDGFDMFDLYYFRGLK